MTWSPPTSLVSFLDTLHPPCTLNSSLIKILAVLYKALQLYNTYTTIHYYNTIHLQTAVQTLSHVCASATVDRGEQEVVFQLNNHSKEEQSISCKSALINTFIVNNNHILCFKYLELPKEIMTKANFHLRNIREKFEHTGKIQHRDFH